MNKDMSAQLKELKASALELMKEAGYEITHPVEVMVEPALGFMGYTTERNGKSIIVVSGNAMKGGMAVNLLIHELSHVYRTHSGHPSHDYELLTAISGWVMQGKIVFDYQERILHTIINHLQDLYADDISFAVFKKIAPIQNLNEFFISWIHEPSTSKEVHVRSWENADFLLSTAFAEANLQRHNVKDTDGKVAKAVKAFLAKSDKRLVKKYPFFKEFMVNLPEKVTEKAFEKLLIQYLSEFLKLTKAA